MSNDADTLTNRFLEFSNARDLPDICSTFSSLCKDIQVDPLSYENFYPSLKSKLQQWKSRSLWELLDARAALPEYCDQTACKGKRVLIIGAGPVGLRTAIEAALLGAEVDVVEKRSSFSRNNVLHLWPFLIDDLRALGAKKFYGKFCAGAIDHICIWILQSLLLKVCLVLGVKIHFPVTFVDLVEPKSSGDNWHIAVDPSSSPLASKPYDAILSADGKKYSLPGFQSKEFRAKLAIAITANFVNKNTDEEVAIEEISGVSYIYNQSFFKSLSAKHGIDLENIVYYKDETHYFVMTAKKTSLLSKGVLKKDYSDPELLLSRNNVSQMALEKYAVEAATYSTKGGLQNVQFAANHHGKNDVAVFDFTSLFASEHASRIVERKGKRILLCVVGDTLLEPFWPTGTGLARGFLGAFDAAWMLKEFCEEKPPLELIEEREALFHLLPSTTPERLQKKTSAYTINPHTRYPNLKLMVPPSDISHLFDSDTQPLRRQQRVGGSSLTEPKVQRAHTIGAQDGQKIQLPRLNREAIRPSLSPERTIDKTRKAEDEVKKKEGGATPQHSSSESYLMKFAKKLFGIKSSKQKQEEEGAGVAVQRAPSREETKSEKKQRKRTPTTSPHKSPKRRRKKSKPGATAAPPVAADSKPQNLSDESLKEKQQRATRQSKSPGVLELAKFYESSNVSGSGGDQPRESSKVDERREERMETVLSVDKRTEKTPKGERKGISPRVEKTEGVSKVEKTERPPRVLVASAIKRLEEYKKEGFDMADYEIELMEFVADGIEEVDAGVLDAMEKYTSPLRELSETDIRRPEEEDTDQHIDEGEEPDDGLAGIGATREGYSGGGGEIETESEETKRQDVEERESISSGSRSLEGSGAPKQDTGERVGSVNLVKEDQLVVDVTKDDVVKYCEERTVLGRTPNPIIDEKESGEDGIADSCVNPLKKETVQEQSVNVQSTVEETKLKMGLPASIKTYTKARSTKEEGTKEDREETVVAEPMSPFKSPIRKGSKDDSAVKVNVKTSQTTPIPAWQKRFAQSLTLILENFRNETDLHSLKTALEIIKFIYKNTIDDPQEDTYRRVRVSSSRFMISVWQYSCAQQFFLSCGWMEVDDYLVLPMEQSLEIVQEVVDRQIEMVDMMMQSEQISRMMSRQQNLEGTTDCDEDTYTDSIVLQGVAKANLDCSVQIAKSMKGSLSTQNSTISEDTDHPWISKKEELLIVESASQARQWWERKTLTKHPSTYSLYFQEEELDQLKYLAGLEDDMRGRVAERIKELEGRSSSSDNYSTTSTDEDISSSQEEEEEEEREEEEAIKENEKTEDNSSRTENSNTVEVTSKDARALWIERSKGTAPKVSDRVNPNKVIKMKIEDDSPSETMLKWESAQRVAEQLSMARQQSKNSEQ